MISTDRAEGPDGLFPDVAAQHGAPTPAGITVPLTYTDYRVIKTDKP